MATTKDRLLITISATAQQAVDELRTLEGTARDADGATIDLGQTLKTGLVAGAAALAGTGLVAFLHDSTEAFLESQDAALQFARATNATVAEAGRFTSVARQLGLDLNDLIEINAEFSSKVGEQPDLLADIGVELAKNADGSVNMTRTLVETIDTLGQMEDGLAAAQTAAELFGEEGSKQLAGFYLQGIEVADLMDRIDFVDRSEDAKRYAASTIEMKLSMEQLQTVLGAEIVPLMTGLADAAADVFGFMSQIPAEVYLVAGAFGLVKAVNAAGLFAGLGSTLATTATGFAILSKQTNIFAASWKGLTAAMAANPLGLTLVAAAAAYTAVSVGADNAAGRTREFVAEWARLEGELGRQAALEETAEQMQATASTWEKFITGLGNSEGYVSPINNLAAAVKSVFDDEESVEDYERALQKAREEMGDYAVVAGDVQDTQGDLNDLVAEFVNGGADAAVTWADIAEAAGDAAAAQAKTDEVTRLVAEAMAIATGDAGFFLDALRDLENIGGSSVESLKQKLGRLDFKQVADQWGDEAKIAAEDAYDTLVNGLIAAVEENPQLDLSGWLAQFEGFSPDLDAVIDRILTDVSSDKQLTAALAVARGESVDQAQAELAQMAEPVETTLAVATSFGPDGYNALKDRKDYLAQAVETGLAIDVSFGPGGYDAVKARKDYLLQNRTAYIDVVVRGASAAQAQLAAIAASQPAAAQQAAAVSPVVNNQVRVMLDGQQLRGVVRDEVRYTTVPAGGLP